MSDVASATMHQEQEYCPCPKQTPMTQKVTIEGETWWQCDYQGCELRVSGALHYWRPGEGVPESQSKIAKKGSKATNEDESDDEDEEVDEG